MMTTIQTIIDLREAKNRTFNQFVVDPNERTTNECLLEDPLQRALHIFLDTCPTFYDSICDDPLFNQYNEFEFRCRYPLKSKSVVSMNSSSFLELTNLRDTYGRDWCMIVMFHSPSCPFSARLAPYFNEIAGSYTNILPVAIDASDFTKSHRLNFRYGVSGTPTILLWVNGMSVARMSNKKLDLESIKALIATHTDLVENKNGKNNQSFIPVKLENVGYEVKDVATEITENRLVNGLYIFACLLVCLATFIYHVRERILLSAPVLQWFQSKCGGPLCEDIYFLFYVAAPRNRHPPPAPQAPPEAAELPPLVIEDE